MADTGWLSFTTAANDATTGTCAWYNTSGALVSSDASIAASGSNFSACNAVNTQYLLCTELVSPPSDLDGAAIKGVIARFNCAWQGASGHTDNSVRLYVGGSIVGTDKADGRGFQATLTNEDYGSATDTWGLTLNGSQVITSDFGVGFSIYDANNTGRVNVDLVQIRIYYDVSPMFLTL